MKSNKSLIPPPLKVFEFVIGFIACFELISNITIPLKVLNKVFYRYLS